MAIPHDLQQAAKNRSLLPFIGSGFSRNISPQFPMWPQFMEMMAKVLDCEPRLLGLQGDYLQIAEYLKGRLKLEEVLNEAQKLIDDHRRFKTSDSPPHRLLPHIDCATLFTTNWDSWIERGFKDESVCFQKIAKPSDFVTPDVWKPTTTSGSGKVHETVIVKYHGDFNHSDYIVVNESSYYDRLDFDHPFDIRLRSELLEKSVIFIGYSFTDPNVRYVWHKLYKTLQDDGGAQKSFFVSTEQNPVMIELLLAKNIELIPLNPLNPKVSLTELLEEIINFQ